MRRHSGAPILTRSDIPEIAGLRGDMSSVFNPGAIRCGDEYRLLLRVQARSRESHLLWASSRDGRSFSVEPRLMTIAGIEHVGERIYHVYDPRLTQIEDTLYCCFAADIDGGCRVGIARVKEDWGLELLSYDQSEDSRNAVLFPRKIGGSFLRLDRPNRQQHAGGPSSGSVIEISRSKDLQHWERLGPVASGRPHFWDELIGAGPPAIECDEGWLQVYHGVATHFASSNIYQAGVLLLDKEDPRKVLRRSRGNILEPREIWELTGQVPGVVFPSGLVRGQGDELLLYYGAADSCVGLATTTVAELLLACDDDAHALT
ncbi:MAG: glycosidase [Planctomycetota bacterium]|nr:MAG: glycosidase [Planctomycetota bacterium]